MYTDGDNGNSHGEVKDGGDSPLFRSFMESHIHQQQAPKLEDFLGGDITTTTASAAAAASHPLHSFRYSDVSQTETQDSSSLTHIYDGSSSVYFAATAGFPTFSANSGSEVDDSATQMTEFVGQSIESGNELAYSQCPMNALSLGITTTSAAAAHRSSDQKAVIAVDSAGQNNCKKISDTFGQRTSIYRGVSLDTGGLEDTKRIFGIIAVGERVKPGKDVKCPSGICYENEKESVLRWMFGS